MKFSLVKITNTWAYISTKNWILCHILKWLSSTTLLAQLCGTLYKLRETINKGQLVQYIRSYVSPNVHYGILLYGLGAKTKLQKILITQKRFELPYGFPLGTSFSEKSMNWKLELYLNIRSMNYSSFRWRKSEKVSRILRLEFNRDKLGM